MQQFRNVECDTTKNIYLIKLIQKDFYLDTNYNNIFLLFFIISKYGNKTFCL